MIAIVALIVALAVGQSSPTAESVGRLSGRVVLDGTNTPISSARVTLLPAARPTGPFGPPPQTTTDQDGRFLFDRVVPGEYHVQVQKTGYATLFELSSDRSVRIAAGGAVEVALRLQKGAAISGRVIDALGEPVADARVIAIRRFGQRGGGSTGFVSAGGGGGQQTNDLGEFRVSGLMPGEYIIAAMPQTAFGSPFGGPGMPPPTTARAGSPRTITTTTYYPGTIDQAAAQPIAVVAGSEIGNITFTIQSAPAYRVSGIVVDENGSFVVGAMVMLMSDPRAGAMMGPAGSARSGDGGRFVIDGVVSGSYRATASIPMATNSGISRGGVGGVVTGGVVTWSVGGGAAPTPQESEVVVADANVTGVRVVVRRPS